MTLTNNIWAATLVTLALSHTPLRCAETDSQSGPRFLIRPSIHPNPIKAVPLAAILKFETDRSVNTTVHIEGPEREWRIDFDATADPRIGLPILGMRPGRRHILRTSIKDLDGRMTHSRLALVHNTPHLPTSSLEWPRFLVTTRDAEAMEPGITLLSVRRTTLGREFRKPRTALDFSSKWGLLMALDAEGEVVWSYHSDERIAGIGQLRSGNLQFQLDDFRTVEIDFLGNKVSEYYAEHRPDGPVEGAIPIKGIQTLHHQPREMPNGNFLALSANARTIEHYYTSLTDRRAPRAIQQVMGDAIIEFDPAGEIIWRWNSFDYLDVFRVGYGLLDTSWTTRGFPNHLDWTHGNGLVYDQHDDSIIVNLKHQDALLKVDRASLEIRWILGEHTHWSPSLRKKLLTRPEGMAWPYHTHNLRFTDESNIILYENAQWGARPLTGRAPYSPNHAVSRTVEYRIDEQNMSVSEVWSSAKAKSADTCHAPFMGDAHRLPRTRNILMIDSICFDQDSYPLTYNQHDFSKRHWSEINHHARIREYTASALPTVLWEVQLDDPHGIINWHVYGGLRLPSLYANNKN